VSPSCHVVCFALSRCQLKLLSRFRIYDLRITIYEVFGVVEEFGRGYVVGLSAARYPVVQLSGSRGVC